MKYKKLIKVYLDESKSDGDYGYMSEEEIKLQTKGFAFDKELKIFTRKGCGFFYMLQ